jgi:hypothetical protein
MTITLTREEAQSVLEWVEAQQVPRMIGAQKIIETLRARLSAPEPEPVAWMQNDMEHFSLLPDEWYVVPVYATPTQREWQGLTDEEITALKRNGERYISSQDFARAIEAKLKEKNT